jgi:hypothetical protein
LSNSGGKSKLKHEDIKDLVLGEEVHRKDAGETSGSSAALNLEERGRSQERNSRRADLNSERVGANPSLGDNLSVKIVARQATSRRTAEN